MLSVLLAGGGTPLKAQDAGSSSGENGFSVSISLFSALAAINAAGYDTGMDSPLNEQYRVRTQVRAALAQEKIACLPELKAFYQEHKKPL